MGFRVAAIEISHWHALHDPAYLRQLCGMADVSIVGVQDPDRSLAAKCADEIGSPPVYADYRRMLDETKPDFVIALGRHGTMAEKAHYLLDHGFPFIMEKPMGRNAAEVAGIVEKARAGNGFAAVPLPLRFYPFYQQAKRMLAEDRFGPLSHVYMRMNRFSSARYAAWGSPWMLDPAVSAGGALRNLGAHGFDLFRLLTDEAAEVTGAQVSARALGQRVEDYASVLMRTPSGVLGTLEVGNTYPRETTEGLGKGASPDRFLDGADGEFKICGRDAMLSSKNAQIRIIYRDREVVLPGAPQSSPSAALLRDALERWQRGEPPSASVEDCHRAMLGIDRAYELAGVQN